jgi:hypothetical protein
MLDDAIQSVNEWSQSWDSACNVFEDEQGFTVQMALSGRRANQVEAQVENNMFRLKGNGSMTSRRTDHGIGRGGAFTFPKREEGKPRQIMIECQ